MVLTNYSMETYHERYRISYCGILISYKKYKYRDILERPKNMIFILPELTSSNSLRLEVESSYSLLTVTHVKIRIKKKNKREMKFFTPGI